MNMKSALRTVGLLGLIIFLTAIAPFSARADLSACDTSALSALSQEGAWRAFAAGDLIRAGEIEQTIAHHLQTASIVRQEVIRQGSSESYWVEFADGTRAIFKPAVKHWRLRRVRPFHYDDMPDREIAAYKLDRLLGMHLIPVTVGRQIKGAYGSLQIFVRASALPVNGNHNRSQSRLDIFDYIAAVNDRVPSNIIAWEQGLAGVDNALAFLLAFPNISFQIKIPPTLEKILALPDLKQQLATIARVTHDDFHTTLSGHLSPQEISAAFQRYSALVSN